MPAPHKITIITVCYNSVKTIEQTIQSVLKQNYPHVEYIIIDGASKDGTQKIISQYADKISLFKSEPDNGIYDAMNKGLKLASGDIIGLLNADDIYAHGKVLSMVNAAFEQNVDACYGDLIYFQDANPNSIVRYWKSNDFKPGLFAKGWCPPHPTFFVRRTVYEQHGLFDTSYRMGNDVELMMRFLEKAKIKTTYIPQVLVHMRAGGVSNRSFKNIVIQNKSILQAAKAMGLPFSTLSFVSGKVKDRLLQFIFKPTRDKQYVE